MSRWIVIAAASLMFSNAAIGQTSQCQWVGSIWTCNQLPESRVHWEILRLPDVGTNAMDAYYRARREREEAERAKLEREKLAAERDFFRSQTLATAAPPVQQAIVPNYYKSIDLGETEYNHALNLWQAKDYHAAEQSLNIFISKFPSHPKISHARHILGRTYLDEGKLQDAGRWFEENFWSDKGGAQAPDSLLFLAEVKRREGPSSASCNALALFPTYYPTEAAGRLKDQFEALRTLAKCS